MKTLPRRGLIVLRTTFKDFVCETFTILDFISQIIEQVAKNNSVAAVSNTDLIGIRI